MGVYKDETKNGTRINRSHFMPLKFCTGVD